MKITVQTPDAVDLAELATFIYHARRPEFDEKDIGAHEIEDRMREQISGKSVIFVIASEGLEVIGWIVLLPVSRARLQVNLDSLIDGRPVVDPAYLQGDLAGQLIKTAEGWARKNGYAEIMAKTWFSGSALAEGQNEWFRSLGFLPEYVYVGMDCDLTKSVLPDVAILKGIVIGDLERADAREPRELFVEAFRDGDAVFFHDKTDVEIDGFFDSLGYQEALKQKGSIILTGEDGRLVGFSMVLAFEETARHISCMCVHPEFRGLGLGKLLLRVMMQRIAAEGIDTLTLGTEKAMRAYRLYANHGFMVTWGEAVFVLTVA